MLRTLILHIFFRKHEIKKMKETRVCTPGMQLAKAACPTAKLRAPGTRARSIFRPAGIKSGELTVETTIVNEAPKTLFVNHLNSVWDLTVAKNGRETPFSTDLMDRQTDQPTAGHTDKPSCRDSFLTDTSKNATYFQRCLVSDMKSLPRD